jgi:SET domain-containing protein
MDVPPETRLLEYVGKRITKAESLVQCELENPFIFTLDDGWDLDGNVDFNPARWINHSCDPNAEARLEDGHIWIYSTKEIRSGEEIGFNYNYDLIDYKEHPCKCGSSQCVGYMVSEEFFEDIRRMTANKIPV